MSETWDVPTGAINTIQAERSVVTVPATESY